MKDKSKDKCPYKWWKHHESSFKLLAPVARKWLGCFASSVPCER
ncbi:MAG: hAT transposon family protein, partial [Candidatus Scalindua sp.]|nr:hAT transposon family protein [Candidatus Scalindua sp.]